MSHMLVHAYICSCVCVFARMLTHLFPCLSVFNLQFSASTFSFSLLLTCSSAAAGRCECSNKSTTTTKTTTASCNTQACIVRGLQCLQQHFLLLSVHSDCLLLLLLFFYLVLCYFTSVMPRLHRHLCCDSLNVASN